MWNQSLEHINVALLPERLNLKYHTTYYLGGRQDQMH